MDALPAGDHPPANSPGAVAAAAPATRPAEQPFLIHLPGIAGECVIDHRLVDGLQAGGLNAQWQIYNWPGPDPGIPALRNYTRNQAQAQIIADRLTHQFHDHPTQPIELTAHSGGAGLAVWALEKLPADVTVANLLLLAPALSPRYDLSKALAHVRGHVYVFSSPLDAAVLGAGTKLFGTIDGQHEEAAGKVGFIRPEGADEKQYQKLVAEPYKDEWMKLENLGDHIGVTAGPFARQILAPLLLGQAVETAGEAAHVVADGVSRALNATPATRPAPASKGK